MIHAIWCTMFSVTLPPENSQNRRQLMNLLASKERARRPFRKASQFTFWALQSAGIGRTHCPFPWGVLRLIHDETWVTLPTIPSLTHFLVSAKDPELSCCRPIWTTRFEFFAAAKHCSASGIDHVIVFSEYRSLPAASVSRKCRA